MACKECEERRKKLRDAILRGKMAEAAGHVVAGVREMVKPAAPVDASIKGMMTPETIEKMAAQPKRRRTK